MPSDERYQTWSYAIGSHSVPPYKGFICINHFNQDDLVVGKERIDLKKGALPKIFNANHSNQCINLKDISNPHQAPVADAAQCSEIQCRQEKRDTNCDELKNQIDILKAE